MSRGFLKNLLLSFVHLTVTTAVQIMSLRSHPALNCFSDDPDALFILAPSLISLASALCAVASCDCVDVVISKYNRCVSSRCIRIKLVRSDSEKSRQQSDVNKDDIIILHHFSEVAQKDFVS